MLTDKVTLECGWLAISPQPQTLLQAETDDDSPLLRSMPSITSSLDFRDLIARCSRFGQGGSENSQVPIGRRRAGSLGGEMRATRGTPPRLTTMTSEAFNGVATFKWESRGRSRRLRSCCGRVASSRDSAVLSEMVAC